MTETDDGYQRISLRLPRELHETLMLGARARSRSMNAEIIRRLEESYSTRRNMTLDEQFRSAQLRNTEDTMRIRLKAVAIVMSTITMFDWLSAKMGKIPTARAIEHVGKFRENIMDDLRELSDDLRKTSKDKDLFPDHDEPASDGGE